MLPDSWDTSKLCYAIHSNFYHLSYIFQKHFALTPSGNNMTAVTSADVSDCFCVLQPTGRSGVPAFPPGRPAQRGQQGHRQAERHRGGLRPPAVSHLTDRVCTCTGTWGNCLCGTGNAGELFLDVFYWKGDILPVNNQQEGAELDTC